MAKKSFKDFIFKFLKKDEDAPANATGTAVAGTGDDSSTVVVKKKKELQKKLMKRMGITETINRTIPDLEYPKDEIRERVNQLKELASIEESAAAKEIDRTNTRRDSMDYKMYKKSAELLRKKDYKALGKHIHKSDTAPREYVMDVISKKEPATFKKIYGNQTGFLATMKPLNMGEADLTKGQIKKVHKMADELPKKDFKDRYGKEKGDSVRYATATNIVKDKEGIKEMQQIDEKIKGIQTKSEKSGIPYGILKQVYNRGMAAWKGGHRPGTTPQQWAFARVNAFITKGKAYYTADADLAKKARAAKKGKK